nr:MAG TPA: Trypsin [Caudoviricetes sp.]
MRGELERMAIQVRLIGRFIPACAGNSGSPL